MCAGYYKLMVGLKKRQIRIKSSLRTSGAAFIVRTINQPALRVLFH